MAMNGEVLAIILGGGQGTGLFPLTQLRSKPAVPIGGQYRLIDIPISNCLHADVRRIFVLTQFNSASLNHHVTNTYRFSIFSKGFVNILAAEQTPSATEWYQGTADAIRKSLHHVRGYAFNQALILSGDQLYVTDFRRILETHARSRADITVAATPVSARDVSEFGILQIDAFERGRETVGVALAPDLAVGDDVDAGRFLRADREQRRIVLRFFQKIFFDTPELAGPHARRNVLGEALAVDEPVGLRVAADERGGKKHRAILATLRWPPTQPPGCHQTD